MFSYKDKEFDDVAIEVTKNICESAIRNNVYLEINCNKIRDWINNGKPFVYPNESFWKIVSEYKDIKVVIGSDAHNPEYVYDEAVEYAYSWAKKLNLNVVNKIDIIG
jgi:histidinol-phosphatase (PHP family)